MTVGDTVVFIGPEYGFGAGGPTIGERGVILALDGLYVQSVGGQREELVTVKFLLDDRPTVVSLRRLKEVES